MFKFKIGTDVTLTFNDNLSLYFFHSLSVRVLHGILLYKLSVRGLVVRVCICRKLEQLTVTCLET